MDSTITAILLKKKFNRSNKADKINAVKMRFNQRKKTILSKSIKPFILIIPILKFSPRMILEAEYTL